MASSNNIRLSPTPAPPLSFRQANPLIAGDWDEVISQQPGASIFHQAAWAKTLARTYGFTPIYLTGFCDQKPVAALPLVEVDSWLTGKRGVSLPFTDECEPLSMPEAFLSPIVQEALRLGRERGWKHLELRGGKNPFNNAAPSITFHGHKLKLSATTGALFDRFESSVRRALRKSEKNAVRVEFAQTLEATTEYYALHCQTRKQHGLPPQPFNFFRRLQEHVLAQNLGVVVTARLRDQPVASAIFFHHGRKAIYKFGASLKAALDARANNLVMWEAIQWLAARGVEELSFGRTSLHNEGLRRYKLGWGTEEYPINYYRYDLHKEALVPEADATAGWQTRLFRALPVSMAKCAGKVLYKHFA